MTVIIMPKIPEKPVATAIMLCQLATKLSDQFKSAMI